MAFLKVLPVIGLMASLVAGQSTKGGDYQYGGGDFSTTPSSTLTLTTPTVTVTTITTTLTSTETLTLSKNQTCGSESSSSVLHTTSTLTLVSTSTGTLTVTPASSPASTVTINDTSTMSGLPISQSSMTTNYTLTMNLNSSCTETGRISTQDPANSHSHIANEHVPHLGTTPPYPSTSTGTVTLTDPAGSSITSMFKSTSAVDGATASSSISTSSTHAPVVSAAAAQGDDGMGKTFIAVAWTMALFVLAAAGF
ncbi:hypothetical protein F5Y15DRAFT_414361 [Xylariaceae sp. FL0016]|nr:hypothetical protein F5Y15DRAFT_414361 [Xylariaceae sp. FL0016]